MNTYLPLVSVVTPVYNGEEYLAECIDSVRRQEYENWEYIIVNNCSSDRSLEIASEYAKRDQRIRIYNNSVFLTQAQNHNRALRYISDQSKYCKMVLADDWIFPECIRLMVNLAEENPSVGIVGSYRLVGTRLENDGLPYPSRVVPGREICRLQLLKGIFVFGSQNSVLIRSDIVRSRNPFFNEGSLHFDTEACYEILQSHHFGFVHQVLTFTRTENDSTRTRTLSFNPNILDKLIQVKKYGPIYLSSLEFRDLSRRIEERYYRFLGESVFEWKGEKQFWQYHTQGLQTIGERIKLRKLTKHALIVLVEFLLNLKRVWRFIMNRLR